MYWVHQVFLETLNTTPKKNKKSNAIFTAFFAVDFLVLVEMNLWKTAIFFIGPRLNFFSPHRCVEWSWNGFSAAASASAASASAAERSVGRPTDAALQLADDRPLSSNDTLTFHGAGNNTNSNNSNNEKRERERTEPARVVAAPFT